MHFEKKKECEDLFKISIPKESYLNVESFEMMIFLCHLLASGIINYEQAKKQEDENVDNRKKTTKSDCVKL